MPNLSLAPEAAPALNHAGLMGFLRGRDNPFDLFVAPRKPEADFARQHVPAVHREAFDTLQAVLERYRLARLERESDLPRAGVVVVLGVRGMGKTHLVHALQQAPGGGPRLVVTPALFEPHRPFVEYLLHQLVRHLQNEGDGRAPGTLELLADALARQVLAQAFHGMTEIDWLGRQATTRGRFWRYLFGWGTHRLAEQKRLLIHDLDGRQDRTVLEVCQRHELDAAELHAVATEHVRATEPGLTVGGQIRRGLYLQLIELAFGGPREAAYEFLLDGYTEVEANPRPSRETLVDELFQALLELCLLARLPVAFAFDALETLLGDPPDRTVAHAFFKGLADVLDSHRGIPLLLFAEGGHWQQLDGVMSEYAKQRFQQGVVRVPGRGSVHRLSLPPVNAPVLAQLVAARMKPLLAEYHGADEFDVPATFPFQDEDLARIVRTPGNEPPLRQALQTLRDRYEELVNHAAPATPGAPAPVASAPAEGWIEPLERCWQRELRTARNRIGRGGLAALADELHAGLLSWLQALEAEGAAISAGRPAAVENLILGSHPTYGQITKCAWDGGGHAVGIGFLLGEKKGMPHDLDTKLKILAGPQPPVERLVVLWPRGADLAPPVEQHLPPGTRAIWDQHSGATRERVVLRSIGPETLAPWLAVPAWRRAVRAEVEGAPPELLHHFLVERLASQTEFIVPRS